MTLKTVLRNFLNHVESIEARRQVAEDLYEIEFQKLKELTETLKQHQDYSVREGELEVNKRKNRYKDILPYDHTRVIVSEYPGVPGSDYVNANYIKGASGSLAYIASQGPLPNTVADFWRMIWECEVQVIVMACNERESGKYKCECYWPNEDGETERQYGNITVELVKWRQVCPDFLVRTLKYRCLGEEERSLCQFHYTSWPDHGVPTTVQPILDMVRLMRDCQASEAVPILIHCSAGCGRTGTICAIDYVWSLMRLGKLSENFNLYEIVSDMRKQRIAMVQTKEQYILVHRAVSSLFEQQLRVIDNHTYENLDGDGQPLMLRELQTSQEHIYEDVSTLIALESTRKGSDDKKTNHVYENLDCLKEEKKGEDDSLLKRRNSQILQKLCQEESVKRLISGWNKGSVDNQEGGTEVPNPEEQAEVTEQTEVVVVEPLPLKPMKPMKDGISPSEKLIGKATVIRRPSIAKLKALFEKSQNAEMSMSVNEVMVEDSKRRVRPLGRSHSHHVSRGRVSPSSDESDTRRNVERERSVRRIVSPLAREVLARAKSKTAEQAVVKSEEQVGNGTRSVSVEPDKVNDGGSSQWYTNNQENAVPGVQMRETGSLKVGCLELRADKSSSWYGEYDGKSSRATWYHSPEMEKLSGSASDINQQPPELPIKKKFLKAEAKTTEKKELNGSIEKMVAKNGDQGTSPPEDSQSPPRLPEKKVIGRNTSIKHKQRNELLLSRIDGVVQCRKSVCIPVSDSDHKIATKESPAVVTLAHTQSLKHGRKPTGDTIADRYTNINLTSQKNIAQIENTIKQHPRGAIIDLTSRTSFVEQQRGPPIDPRANSKKSILEAAIANSQLNKQTDVLYETLWGTSQAPSQDAALLNSIAPSKPVDVGDSSKVKELENSAKVDAVDANNLLLHSPPPRARRHHASKPNAKIKPEVDDTKTPTDKPPSISSDQEINRAVKDLNTIGYLLDALATQTLEDLKKDNGSVDESIGQAVNQEERPILPKKLGRMNGEVVEPSELPSTIAASEGPTANFGTLKLEKDIPSCQPKPYPIDPLELPRIERPPAIPRDYEYIYPLQKSSSAPHPSKILGMAQSQGLVKDRLSYYQPNQSGPPKPPRTFTHVPQHKYDGGRLLVSVASPKASKADDAKHVFRYDGHPARPLSNSYHPAQSTYTYPENFPLAQNETYNSQPTSPMHASFPSPALMQGIRNPQPLSYRTYPSYPEIHSVRAVPHHVPLDPSSIHQVRPTLPREHYQGHFGHPVHHRDSSSNLHHPGTRANPSQYRFPDDKTHTIPDYGEVPVVPVYTMVRQDHRVQWDSSVDEQQQGKTKNYENIYDVPKECSESRTPNYDPSAYAVVNKTHELRHSQSDASVYTVLRANRGSDGPLYSQVVKSKKSKSEGEQRHRRSRDDMDILPVAPPRNKRQGQLRRSLPDGGLSEQGLQGDDQSDSEEEEPPAVPAKTKGAYISVHPHNSQKVGKSSVREQGGLGGTLSRALGKLNLLTKLTSKTETNEQVPRSPLEQTTPVCEDAPRDKSPTKRTNNITSSVVAPPPVPSGPRSPIFGFPHRMQKRPKGPREPPEQWTQV